MAKTYGEKPIIFSFEENGEQYMIGSEVGNYLRLFRGALYKKYPGLARRNLTNDERRKLVEMGHSQHVTSSTISLLLANQVEDILNGQDDQLKADKTIIEKESTGMGNVSEVRKKAPGTVRQVPVPQQEVKPGTLLIIRAAPLPSRL